MRMVNIVKGANLKKLSILVILLISVMCLTFAFMPASAVSHAETDGTYQLGTYRVKNNVSLDVYTRLLNGTEIKLFEIPSTYYFDVTEIDGDVFYIKYNGLDDLYVKDASNFVSLTDADKEPLGGFTIDLSLSSDASFYVKGRSGFTTKTLTPAEAPAITFIGKGEYDGTSCIYVRCGGEYGYIPTSCLKTKDGGVAMTDYIIDLHPNYRPTVVPDKTVETKAADPNKLTRIILIVGIVVPALVIVLLLFKPSKKGRYDYDRNSTMNDYGASPYDRPRSRYRDDYDDGRRRDDYRRDRRPDDDYDDGYYDNRRY